MKAILVVAACAAISGQALAQSTMPGAPETSKPAAPSQPITPVTPETHAPTHNPAPSGTAAKDEPTIPPKSKLASPELESGWMTRAWSPGNRINETMLESGGLSQPDDVLAIARVPDINPITTAAAYSSVKLTPSLRSRDSLIFSHSGFFRAKIAGRYVFQISVTRAAAPTQAWGIRCASRLLLNDEQIIIQDFGILDLHGQIISPTPVIGGVDLVPGYFKIEWVHWCDHPMKELPASLSSWALKVREPGSEDMDPVKFFRPAKN